MATVDRFEPQALTGIAWGEITAAWVMDPGWRCSSSGSSDTAPG